MIFRRLIILGIVFFTLVTSAHAESAREELKRLTAQLRQNPTDSDLREKIIKLAQTIKPAPTVPEEALRYVGRGQAAFKLAKQSTDFENAVREFQTAANVAPWYAVAYFNLGVAQEKASKASDAIKSFKLYLLAAPQAKDAAEVKQRLYELEYIAEQQSTAAVAERERKRKEGVLKNLEGAQWKNDELNHGYCMDQHIELHQGEIFIGWIVTRPHENGCHMDPRLGQGWWIYRAKLNGSEFNIDGGNGIFRGKIEDDGNVVTVTFSANGPPFSDSRARYTRVNNPSWTIMPKR